MTLGTSQVSILQIIGHFPPRLLQVRPSAKDPDYEELVIPERLREFSVSLIGISGILKPTQEMANFVGLELARGRAGRFLGSMGYRG